jgi:hypothetical protein
MIGAETIARFFFEPLALSFNRIQKYFLVGASGRKRRIKRGVMVISSFFHFIDQRFMPQKKSFLPANPAFRLRVRGITASAAVFCQDVPEAVQFPVFSEEMFAAQVFNVNIPDPHVFVL